MSNINPYIHDFTVDLRNGVTMERAKKPLSQGDAFANKIVVHVLKDGQTVPLDGVAVSASVIRYDGATVPLTGTVEEGAACIVLNDECYAVPGDLLVSVVLAVGEVKQTILRLMLNVETSQTDIIADGGVIGSFSQLLAEIENMRSATAAAISAAERAEAAADKAEGIAPGGGGTGTVTSVNGVEPDEEGNVQITIPEVPAWAMAATKPTYTAKEVGADPAGTAASKVSTHNADEEAHPAIRQLVSDLSGRLSALADSDDTTLDQLSEIVAYIKSNKSLIDSITTGKVSTADIVNNLTSTATNKPLSAAQGKALKALIDAIAVPTKTSQLTNDSGYLTKHQDISHLLPRTELGTAIDEALSEAKESGAFKGDKGDPGDDYVLTEEDKDEIATLVPTVKEMETPTIVESVDDMTDTSKHYVLDGYIWHYKKVVTPGETTYPNVFDKSTATINGRLSVSTGAAASATTGSKGCFITDFIELKNWADLSSYMVRVNFELQSTDIDANEVFFFNSSKALTGTYVHMFKAGSVVTIGGGKTSFDLKQWEAYSSAADAKYVKLRLYKKASGTALTTADLDDVEITFDGNSVTSEGTTTQEWVNSGIPYAPTFQTDMIGVLGEGNVVYLSDNLPAGTYTLKYGDDYDTVGSITVQ